MNLLLDTQVLLWWLSGNSRLGTHSTALIAEGRNTTWVSAATILEMAIKVSLGKLSIAEPIDELLPAIAAHRFRELPIAAHHAIAVAALPWHHRDPFDRLLVAQARVEDLTLITSDSALAAYDIDIVRADT